MKYPPKYHQETDYTKIIATIKKYPLATIISTKNDEIFTTHIPLLYVESKDKFGSLIGHIDRFNPHVNVLKDNANTHVIFHGPDTYISPNVYHSKQLPTWNYIKVHFNVKTQPITDPEEVKSSIAAMTSFLETSENPFVLDTNDTRVNSLVNYIVGFKLKIISWEGKFKLSQDKSAKDMYAAKDMLIKHSKSDISAYLQEILPR